MGNNKIDKISHLFTGIWSLENFDSDLEIKSVIE